MMQEVGADVTCGPFKRSALSAAAAHGRLKAIQLLLERPDIQVDVCDLDGKTPLMHAARQGHPLCVRECD